MRAERASEARKKKQKRATATVRQPKTAQPRTTVTLKAVATRAGGATTTGGAEEAGGVRVVGGSDGIDELIATWKPGRGLEDVAEVWDEVGPVVREILLQFSFPNKKRAGQYISSLARHTTSRFRAGHLIGGIDQLLSEEALASTLGVSKSKSSGYSSQTLRRDLGDLRNLRSLLAPDLYGKSEVLKYG